MNKIDDSEYLKVSNLNYKLIRISDVYKDINENSKEIYFLDENNKDIYFLEEIGKQEEEKRKRADEEICKKVMIFSRMKNDDFFCSNMEVFGNEKMKLGGELSGEGIKEVKNN